MSPWSGVDSNLAFSDYLYSLLGYFFWQISYIVKTEIIDRAKLDKHPELLTSLRWLSADKKNALGIVALKYFRRINFFQENEEFNSKSVKTKATFVVCQFLLTVLTFVPTYLLYYSRAAHLSFIGIIFTAAVFNGASFYIEVSIKFASQLI